jgi:hypothetical protein
MRFSSKAGADIIDFPGNAVDVLKRTEAQLGIGLSLQKALPSSTRQQAKCIDKDGAVAGGGYVTDIHATELK